MLRLFFFLVHFTPPFGIIFLFLFFCPVLESPKPENGENGNANSIEDIVLHIRSGYPDLAETAVHIDDFACDGT